MPQGTIRVELSTRGSDSFKASMGELFFHHSALDGVTIEDLREGQRVEFEEGRGPRDREPKHQGRLSWTARRISCLFRRGAPLLFRRWKNSRAAAGAPSRCCHDELPP